MSGLSINQYQKLLNQKEIRSSENTHTQIEGASSGASFADTLQQAITNVNSLQKEADIKMEALATGKTDDVADVLVSTEKADIALRLMVQVRNKIIDAYHEVMKMQV